MQKHILRNIATVILMGVSLTVMGQSALDPGSRLALMKEQNANARVAQAKGIATSTDQQRKLVLIDLDNTTAHQQLEAAGVKIIRQCGSIAIASVPVDSIENISRMSCVTKMEFGRKLQQKMNRVRTLIGMDKIHEGEGLPDSYSGAGVVTGIVDAGFDPNHINFQNLDGSTRFGYMSHVYESKAAKEGYIYENYYPRKEIEWREEHGTKKDLDYVLEDYKTDDYTAYHGSHTLGIMAGSWDGKVTMGQLVDDDYSPADVNRDGSVNISDVNAVINVICGSTVMASTADVNKDGSVNISDVNAVITVICGGTVDIPIGSKEATVVEAYCPYYGSATASEIVASCGDLADEYVAFGIEDCINYARLSGGVDEETGEGTNPKPCVINLSLGSMLGPHDPNSTINKFLRWAGNKAIICVAAGNQGEMRLALNKTFTDGDVEEKSFIVPLSMYQGQYDDEDAGTVYNIRSGSVYVYSNDTTALDVQAVIFNKKRGTIAMRMPVGDPKTEVVSSWASSSTYDVFGNAITTNTTFNNAFEGYVATVGTIDKQVNRYNACLNFYLSDNQTKNSDSNYVFGLLVKGKAGQTVNAYNNGTFTEFDDLSKTGWDKGSYDGTLDEEACADSIIVVGSYNSRHDWASIDGNHHGYDPGVYNEGEISYYSSYGTLADGTTRPHVCAPGACVISSVNTWCVENASMGFSQSALQAMYTANNRNYYWEQGAGTSMATPVVAGAIATWLEADPTLTVADVLDIIDKTSVQDSYTQKGIPAQWGAGKFDAYAGIKEVLRRKASKAK